jgi:hypothetical protein
MNNEIEENYMRTRTDTQKVVVGKPWRPPVVAKVPSQMQSAAGAGGNEAKPEEKEGRRAVQEMRYERQQERESGVQNEGGKEGVGEGHSQVGGDPGQEVKNNQINETPKPGL